MALIIDVQHTLPAEIPFDAVALDPHADSDQDISTLHNRLSDTAAHDNRAWLLFVRDANWPHTAAAPRLINCIELANAKRYPQIHFRSPLAQSTLTQQAVSTRLDTAYACLIRLQAAELVHCVAAPPSAPIPACLDALQSVATALAPLCAAKPLPVPDDLINACTHGIHFTHSERLQLARLCSRYHALYRVWPTPPETQTGTAKATLEHLTCALDAFGMTFS